MQEEKLKALLQEMSLDDKISQLLQISGGCFEEENVVTGPNAMYGVDEDVVYNIGSIINSVGAAKAKKIQKQYLEKSNYKIPLLFMSDIIYGLKTIFPIPLGSACSWDMAQVKQSAEIAAIESAVMGQHVTFSPMADLVRDARWGRVLESPGEDPYYNCQYTKACVEGFQGEMDAAGHIDAKTHIASCVKHFAAYGAAEGGREYNTVDISRRRLYESYFPAYKAAVDAGAKLVMTSFNVVDGIPASGNQWLMRDVLRNQWQFDGVLISDASAIEELVAHGVAEDKKEAAKMAIEAGVDIDMMSPVYIKNLKSLVEEGTISESLIDDAVYRILCLKNQLGLFENPYGGADEAKEKEVILCQAHRDAARKLAEDSCVLLKNDGVLPLKANIKKIALIGPYADNHDLLGIWAVHGDVKDTVTLKEGFEKAALAVCQTADAPNAAQIMQNADTSNADLTMCQTADDPNKGIEIVTVRGSKMVRHTENIQSFGSIFELEDESGLNEAALLEEAKSAAVDADVIVLALGEHFLQSGEGGSRGDITLPDCQRELLDAMYQLNKPVAVLLFGGRPMDIREVCAKANAVMMCWFPGTEGGNAIANLVFGKTNPSGKLTMSFPYSVGQVPVYYNEYHTGRPYKPEYEKTRFGSKYTDIPNAPLFPFGYGLSYTTFEYGDLKISSPVMNRGNAIEVSCTVKNTGKYAGKETVQLYIQDKVGSVARPVKELKGFKKISLKPDECQQVVFEITEEMLKFYTASNEFKAENGKFVVYIGRNSSDCLEITFTLE